jgi:hypothetical protein
LQHPAEITFYEELGVHPTATGDEIRDSFRALVRILHPDHQTDPQLKEMAERQMRKLNRIYAVLSDSEKRRRYNEALEEENFAPTFILSPNSNVNVRRLMERVAWLGAFVVVAIALVWLASDNPAPIQPEIAERVFKKSPVGPSAPASVSVNAASELAQMQMDLRLVKMERDAAIQELTKLRVSVAKTQSTWKEAEPPSQPPTPLATTITELPSASIPFQPAAAAPGRVLPVRVAPQKLTPPARPFAGFWFYAKPAPSQRAKASSLYAPEFIETTITEQNGVVKGRYRSRYKIVDRAISPDVTFEFTGTTNGSTVICPWIGPGGSKGELTLRMAGENGLSVDWTTTELGSIQGLITGTATLTRRID